MAIRSSPVLGDIFGRGTGGRGVRHVLGPDGSRRSVSGPFRNMSLGSTGSTGCRDFWAFVVNDIG